MRFPRFELIDMYKLHSLQDIYDILPLEMVIY